MGLNKKTVRDISLTGKRVLLRADYNVPVVGGKISDDYRIKQTLPTIEYILRQKPAYLIIISHLGRPQSPKDKQYSLKPVAQHLSKLLGRAVRFAHDCVGDETKRIAAGLKNSELLVLENLRFYPQEEKNGNEFAKALVETTGAEVFVQDGFGVVHREHASTAAITKLLPSVAGLLLENEVEVITKVMEEPDKPLVAIIGGAKISDKIDVLRRLINLADCVAVGGAMANNFLKIEGHEIGQSLYDYVDLGIAHDILAAARTEEKRRPFSFVLPSDVVVSKSMDGKKPTRIVDISSHTLADIESYPKVPARSTYTIGEGESIVDIGPISAAHIAGILNFARTIIWNGTMGITEVKGVGGTEAPFAHGTRTIVDAIIGLSNIHPKKPFSLVGGGDTVGYVEGQALIEDFNHVSTGGATTLELLSGKKLPGIEALLDKHSA